MKPIAIPLASMILSAAPLAAQPAGEAWRGIEGVWRIEAGELCPDGAIWTYAFSDNGRNLLLWTQGSMIEAPVVIPDRLGTPPRLQGRAPFYNTPILERRGNRLRNRHETLRVDGDRLTIDYGNRACTARRAD
jgi:hypothetical protein